jgi:predicted transcriptional regulator
MSITDIRPYGRVYDVSNASKDISLAEIAVYGYLSYLSGSSGSCYPSQRRIADDLRSSREVVILALRRLVDAGLITVSQRHTPGQRRWSYIYTITDVHDPSGNYGRITERMMMSCRSFSVGAIGLLFYATAAAGTGSDLYFKRADLADRLHVSPTTLTKYIRELTAAGEATAIREQVQGAQMTRFIVRPICKIPTSIKPTQTLGYSKLVISSYPALSSPDEAEETKINRKEYLSLDKCATPIEAITKQKAVRKELSEIYRCEDDLQSAVSYDDVASQLKRFVCSGSRAEIMRVVKLDLKYLTAFVGRFPRSWIADPLIRSAALEVVFGSSKTEREKIVLQQLYWILAATGDEQSRLLTHLDGILSGSKDARAWLAVLVGRVDAALSSRPVQHPAAYVRRLILNWLTDRYAQTSDRITQLVAGDSADQPAPIPQTYDELVASSFADRYRPQIRKLSRREYRIRADAYEAIVYEREAAGCPISRYDIATDDEIQDLYALMPESFYETLRMIDPADAEAISLLPADELDRRAFTYRQLSSSARRSIFWNDEYDWLLSPSTSEDEAI